MSANKKFEMCPHDRLKPRDYLLRSLTNIFATMKKLFAITGLALTTLLTACNNNSTTTTTSKSDTAATKITEETATFKVDSVSSISFVAYDANKQGKRPVVLVIPEWWGLNDYAK